MKRKCASRSGQGAPKKLTRPDSHAHESACATGPGLDHPVLRRLYPTLFTLRQFLLSRLPRTSRNRRRRILQLGQPIALHDAVSTHALDIELGSLLDAAVIGTSSTQSVESEKQGATKRNEDIEVFTQQRSQATAGSTFKPGYFLQAEVFILHHIAIPTQSYVLKTRRL